MTIKNNLSNSSSEAERNSIFLWERTIYQKAFITQHNALRIVMRCHLIQIKDVDDPIWKVGLPVFNKLEENELKAFLALMKDEEKFLHEVWRPFEKPNDAYIWMTPPHLPAFHLNDECS